MLVVLEALEVVDVESVVLVMALEEDSGELELEGMDVEYTLELEDAGVDDALESFDEVVVAAVLEADALIDVDDEDAEADELKEQA